MRTKAIFFGTALVLLVFSSCQKIQDSLVVKVPMEISNDLNVTAGGPELKTGDGFSYLAKTTFNPTTDPTYLKYKDKIKSIAATGFSYTPKNLPNPVTILSGTLKIYTGTKESPTKMVKWDFTNVLLQTGVKVILPSPSTGTIADVTTMLDGSSDVTIAWEGKQSLQLYDWLVTFIIKSELQTYVLK